MSNEIKTQFLTTEIFPTFASNMIHLPHYYWILLSRDRRIYRTSRFGSRSCTRSSSSSESLCTTWCFGGSCCCGSLCGTYCFYSSGSGCGWSSEMNQTSYPKKWDSLHMEKNSHKNATIRFKDKNRAYRQN